MPMGFQFRVRPPWESMRDGRASLGQAAEELGRLLDDPALAKVPFAVLGTEVL